MMLGFAARFAWGYDADELQNLHFAWNIAQGKLPYRDFFEHHPPLLHYALAPFISGLDRPGWGLLIAMRIVALAVAGLVTAAFFRLARRVAGRQAATIGVGALLVTHPFGTTIFELRADWFALAAILVAAGGLVDSMRGDRDGPRTAVFAGLLTGIGVLLTQKTALLAMGLTTWGLGCALFSPPERHRGRGRSMAAYVISTGIPIVALAGWFAAQGALGDLMEHTLRINLRWASEGTWRYTVNQSLPVVLPMGTLGLAQLLRSIRHLGNGLSAASPESAIATVCLTGIGALVTTPVPHGQSFLFLVVPWAAILGVVALERVVDRPGLFREDRRYLLAALVACLAAVSPVAAAIAVLVWSGALLAAMAMVSGVRDGSRRLAAAGGVVISLGVVVYVGRAADALWRHEGFAQAAFVEFANDRVPRGTAVLETWPLVTPFRPQPTFHGFARRGPAQTIGVARLEGEYVAALRSNAVRYVVVDNTDIRRQIPGFGVYLDTECRRVPESTKTRDRPALYDCGR